MLANRKKGDPFLFLLPFSLLTLFPSKKMLKHKTYKRVALVILDGFGVASKSRGNAITLAETPNIDALVEMYPHATLQASGPLVGLPFGEPGNSEVGHLSIGAGRIVGQDLPRISKSIEDGSFFDNPVLVNACRHVKKTGGKLHLAGLVSDGGVHSLNEHLYALLGLAQKQGLEQAYVHFFTDGRDAPPQAGLAEIAKLETKIKEIGIGKIASIMGRFYGMDRGGHWEQTKQAFLTMCKGEGEKYTSAKEAIEHSYQMAVYDELLKPAVLIDAETKAPVALIQDNDALIFFNFRQDRMVQISALFADPDTTPLAKEVAIPQNLYIASMTEYTQGTSAKPAFPPNVIKNHLASVLSQNKFRQLHISEREKFAHVTMFFNCGEPNTLPLEERLVIDSPKDNSSSYANVPEMSARELTNRLVSAITKSDFDFVVANYANADMVGHTGNLQSAVKAVKCLDVCLGEVAKASLETDTCLIITADHGNIEQMLDLRSGTPDTDHTANPVPLLLIAKEWEKKGAIGDYQSLAQIVPIGMVADIAPTILELFGLSTPPEMRSVSLMSLLPEH